MVEPWLWLVIAAIAGLWLTSLAAVRYWTNRQMWRRLADMAKEEDLSLPFPASRPEDHQALEVVRAYRRRYLLQVWPETELSFRALLNLSLNLVQQIAAIYHPDEAQPELQASLAELINLQTRISVRLQGLLGTLPLQIIKNLKLQTILSCHNLYQFCVSHPAYRFLRQYRLHKVMQWLWLLKNCVNPWYWGRRAAFSGGKELLSRFFLARFITIVGVEAIRLYSGRHPDQEWGQTFALAWQEICHLTAGDPAREAAAQKYFLRLVLHNRELPETTKLDVLKQLVQPPPEPDRGPGAISARERRRLERWLRQGVHSIFPPEQRAAALAAMRRRLAAIPDEVRPLR
ncbi:MAG: hypothetical protein ACUVRZ_04025 [Desulfobacca sp.]|uniref:hypothetical protein n=1 Tax=Desulfobacca sp. TaxID=2067990 RepID=UPI004049E1B3